MNIISPIVDDTGIHIPTFYDIYAELLTEFRSIYGASIYVEPDSQDGQWIASIAARINSSNMAAQAVFQSFSPTYAQGTNLSSLVKINGIARNIATNSTSQGNCVGVAGTIITNGVVSDTSGNKWNLPASVTIPIGGLITVTVTAQNTGDIAALTGSINTIVNPQLGWQSFISTIDAVPGSPVETDAQLRIRQTYSTSIPAAAILASINGAVGNVAGVSRFITYENDTASTDSNGIPAHSIAVVALGGNSANIAAAIASRKPPGVQTYGSTSVIVYDQQGLASTIHYLPLTLVPIYFDITITALTGYVATTGQLIKDTLAAYVSALGIGEDVYNSQAQASASLIALGLGHTFYLNIFKLGTAPSPAGSSNITILFNQAATCISTNIALTVL